MQPPFFDIERLSLALIVLILGFFITRYVFSGLFRLVKKPYVKSVIDKWGIEEPDIEFSLSIGRLLSYIIFILIALLQIGFAPFVLFGVALVIFLAVIGMLVYSLRDFFSSVLTGAYLRRSGILHENDWITFKGFTGRVLKLELLSVIIKDKKGKLIIIPNSEIKNYLIQKK